MPFVRYSDGVPERITWSFLGVLQLPSVQTHREVQRGRMNMKRKYEAPTIKVITSMFSVYFACEGGSRYDGSGGGECDNGGEFE